MCLIQLQETLVTEELISITIPTKDVARATIDDTLEGGLGGLLLTGQRSSRRYQRLHTTKQMGLQYGTKRAWPVDISIYMHAGTACLVSGEVPLRSVN